MSHESVSKCCVFVSLLLIEKIKSVVISVFRTDCWRCIALFALRPTPKKGAFGVGDIEVAEFGVSGGSIDSGPCAGLNPTTMVIVLPASIRISLIFFADERGDGGLREALDNGACPRFSRTWALDNIKDTLLIRVKRVDIFR